MQVIVDLFGDAPYSDAIKGDITEGLVLSPAFNSAKDVIYPDIERRVLRGLRLLDTVNASLSQPGTNDLIYPNTVDLDAWKDHWRKFGNSLLLKIYMRQGSNAKFAQLYNSPTSDFILTNDDNAKISYTGDAQGSNPL